MISGATKLFMIVADPVRSVRTPQVLNARFSECGLDSVIVPVEVGGAGLASFVAAARHMTNLQGFVVSHPHKIAMAPLCDELSERAAEVGAVNAVRRTVDGGLRADMTDGLGFVRGLQAAGICLHGRDAYLLGAGDAAIAIAVEMVRSGARSLRVRCVDPDDTRRIMHRVEGANPNVTVTAGTADPTGSDLIINTISPPDWDRNARLLDAGKLSAAMVAAETYSIPEITPFLAAAANQGCRTCPGRFMLDNQMDLIAQFIGAI
jgi:shikimate dehydrogenase